MRRHIGTKTDGNSWINQDILGSKVRPHFEAEYRPYGAGIHRRISKLKMAKIKKPNVI